MSRVIRLVLPLLAAACLLAGFAEGVDEKKFRKCGQTGFCARTRSRGPVDYTVLPTTVAQTESGITFSITDASAPADIFPAPLSASLTLLSNGAVRLRAEEAPSVVAERGGPRFEAVEDVLIPGALDRAPGVTVSIEAQSAKMCNKQEFCVVLTYSPFTVETTLSGETAAIVNAERLFGFEQRRSRRSEDDASLWTETFDRHTDNKRDGPTAVSFDVSFPAAHALYGLPEHATSLALKNTRGDDAPYSEPYRLFNLDVFEHILDSPMALYGAVPLVIAHGSTPAPAGSAGSARRPLAAGAFFLNPSEMWVDVFAGSRGQSTHWMAETGIVDLYLFASHAGPAGVSATYHQLTGMPSLPPRFALGYHQCRWNYKSEDDVAAVDAGFDEHDIPYDVMWLDIEHTDGKRYFTWDDKLFPTPADMQHALARNGRHLVSIVDPHVKADDKYFVYREVSDGGHLVADASGQGFHGDCWPGRSAYPDFSRADTRALWASHFSTSKYPGATEYMHVWNDMNEPSVFSGPEVTMPKDALHRHGKVEHRALHNLYGLYYHSASTEGLRARLLETSPMPETVLPDWAPKGAVSVSPIPGAAVAAQRPFVLSRAFFAGTQRVSAIWTGDNGATWEFLRDTTPMLLGLAAGGISFAGADIGGFFGNPDAEMLERWYQASVLTPFYRAHAHIETKRREPWLFGEPHTSRIRSSIRTRYAHLGYLYTQTRLANTTGVPALRPLSYEFPHDPAASAIDAAYLLGPGVMVVPVTAPKQTTVRAYFPATASGARAAWYDSLTLARVPAPAADGYGVLPAPADYIPILYKGGSILPLQRRPRRSSHAMSLDPYSLVTVLDDSGAAYGSLYVDDGASEAFARGDYVYQSFAARVAAPEGKTQRVFTLTNARAPLPSVVPVAPANPAAVAANDIDLVIVAGLPAGHTLANAKVTVGGSAAPTEVFPAGAAGSGAVGVKIGVPLSAPFTITADVVAV